jgi:hypothetical protein
LGRAYRGRNGARALSQALSRPRVPIRGFDCWRAGGVVSSPVVKLFTTRNRETSPMKPRIVAVIGVVAVAAFSIGWGADTFFEVPASGKKYARMDFTGVSAPRLLIKPTVDATEVKASLDGTGALTATKITVAKEETGTADLTVEKLKKLDQLIASTSPLSVAKAWCYFNAKTGDIFEKYHIDKVRPGEFVQVEFEKGFEMKSERYVVIITTQGPQNSAVGPRAGVPLIKQTSVGALHPGYFHIREVNDADPRIFAVVYGESAGP